MLSHLPRLGVGLGYRDELRSGVFLYREQIDFLEIVADHYLDLTPEKEEELELLAAHFTLIPHAINLSLGSAEGVDGDYVRKLAALIRRLDPPWWSEHIAYTRAGGVDIGHLAPLPFARQAVDAVCKNVARVRREIEAPLILENIAYAVVPPFNELDEAAFVSEVVERADCGVLMDVMNLHANAVNHGYDAERFLERIPRDRIVQLHFVGGHWHDGVLVDSHSMQTPPQVSSLIETACGSADVKGAILERDENFPDFEDLVCELDHVRTLAARSAA